MKQGLPGRDEELLWLRDRTARDTAPGSIIVVSGEAGVGKTRLVKEAIPPDRLLARVVFPGRRFTTPGMGLHRLAELAGPEGEALAAELAGPVPPVGTILPAIFRRADALLRAHAPAVLVMDDVQWVDDLSLAWLSQTEALFEQVPIVIVVAVRAHAELPGRLALALAPLYRRGLVEALELAPLGLDGVRDMAAPYDLDRDEDAVLHLHQRSDGLPLVVEEMLRSRRSGVLESPQASGMVGVSSVVSAIVREALEEIPEDGHLLLSACSLAPPPLAEPMLRKVTRLAGERFDRALEDALASGLVVRTEPSGLAFRHDLEREAVQGEIALVQRRSLHRRIAEVLQAEASHAASQISHHLLEAGQFEDAVIWLERAADEAVATHDFGSALTSLAAAVQFGATEVVRVVEKATVAARTVGRQGDAIDLVDGLLQGHLPVGQRARLLVSRGYLAGDQGEVEGALTALQEAREAFIEAGDESGLAMVLGLLALPTDELLPIRERIALGWEGLRRARAAGDAVGVARCAGNLAAAEMAAGHHREASNLWRDAMAAVDPTSSPEAGDEYLRNAANRAIFAVAFGLYEDATAVIREGLRVAGESNPLREAGLRVIEALLLWRTGRWTEALERTHGPRINVDAELGRALAAHIAFERESRPDVAALANAAEALVEWRDYYWAPVAQALLVRVRIARREPMPARGLLPLVSRLATVGIRIGGEDLLPAAAEADPAIYRQALASLGGLAPVGLRVDAASALAEGLVASSEGDVLLLEAADRFEALGEPYPAAQALARATFARNARGLPVGNIAARAASHLHDLGANRSMSMFLRRAPRLRSLEVFRTNVRPRAAEGWALTQREREVADLARRGYTSGQIAESLGISPRTAENHLVAVKGKLGVRRKSELVRMFS